MLNICILELIKNEHGFFTASQSIFTACLRAALKEHNVNSTIYTDDTLASLNALAEDVLSVADDALLLIRNADSDSLVNALTARISELEDVPIILAGPGNALPCMEFSNVSDAGCYPEKTLPGLLKMTAGELSITKSTPYASGILLPQDAEKYGLWFILPRSGEVRCPEALKADVSSIINAYSGLSTENRKIIPCFGNPIREKNLLEKFLECFPESETPLLFQIPVAASLAGDYPGKPLTWQLFLDYEDSAGDAKALLNAASISSIVADASLMAENSDLRRRVLTAVKNGKIALTLQGSCDPTAFTPEELELLLRPTAMRYVPFSRGFIKSRTGVYTGVALDGCVKHVELLKPPENGALPACLNELASINSSVYLAYPTDHELPESISFDKYGTASVSSPLYKKWQETALNGSIMESNLLRMQDDHLHMNGLAYTAHQGLREIPYHKAKETLTGSKDGIFWLFSMDTVEDLSCFLADAEQFLKTQSFQNLPLAHGYLKNYCRFLNSSSCSVDKIPRIQLNGDGNVYACSNFEEPIGTTEQALFELAQSCYVRKETAVKARDCAHCSARSWCAKCTQLPSFLREDYCSIMKEHTYVIDYIMASLVYIDMASSVPELKNIPPEGILVSSEYMHHLTSGDETGSELPYFPKFSYLFTCRSDLHVLWSASSGKFFRVSTQFALFAELLFRKFPLAEIRKRMAASLSLDDEEVRTLCDTITQTLNRSGSLYRIIKE